MSKKCTPLWRKAHLQVKKLKTPHVRTTFGSWDVEKVHAVCSAKHISKSKCSKHHMFGPLLEVQMLFRVPRARDCAPCQKWAKREGFVPFSTTTTTTNTFNYTTLHYTILHYTTLHYTTLDYISLHYTTLHYTTLYHTTLHYTTLHYTTLHYTTLYHATLHYTTLH